MIKSAQTSRRNGNSRNLFGRHNILFLISLFFNIFLAYKLWTTHVMKDLTELQYQEVKRESIEYHQKHSATSEELNSIKHELHETQKLLESCQKETESCNQKLLSEKEKCDLQSQNCFQEKEECQTQLSSRNTMLQTATHERDTCTGEMKKKKEEFDNCQVEKSNYIAEIERLKLENVEANVKEVTQKDKQSPTMKNQPQEPEASKAPDEGGLIIADEVLMSCDFTLAEGPGDNCKMISEASQTSLAWTLIPGSHMTFNSNMTTELLDKASMEFQLTAESDICVTAAVKYQMKGNNAILELKSGEAGDDVKSFEATEGWAVVPVYLGHQSTSNVYELVAEIIDDGEALISVASVDFKKTNCQISPDGPWPVFTEQGIFRYSSTGCQRTKKVGFTGVITTHMILRSDMESN